MKKPKQRKAKAPPTDWRRWGGVLKGTNALQELEEEHRQETEKEIAEGYPPTG